MRCWLLKGLLFAAGLVVLLLAAVYLPVEWLTRQMNRLIDWAEVEYWLAVIERKTREGMKRRGVR